MDYTEIIYPQTLAKNAVKDSNGNSLISPESCFSLFTATHDGFDEQTKMFLNQSFSQRSENHSKSLNLFDKKLWKKTKLFTRQDAPLPKEFKEQLENKFGCDVDDVDMNNSESVSMIKRWIEENISELNCDNFETPNMNNILKMNFEWDSNIKVETSRKKFYVNNNDSFDTDFIDFKGTFNYMEATDLNAKIIEIPLSSTNLTIVLVVPNNKEALKDLENNIPYLHQFAFPNMKNYEMNVSMPKFELKQEHNLKDLLKNQLNSEYPFKFGKTDVYRIGAMKTTSSLEVTEKGIKAAALTACQFLLYPITKEMIYETNISNRFANTLITSKVENVENIPQETTFTVILPEDAFITEFVMEIKGKSYRSYIKEKEEAKNIYDQAVAVGRSAGHVAVSARDSNKFTVSVNIEPKTEMKFLLTYEELLQRRFDQYELVLNIQPGQLVRVLKVLTKINESKPLKFVKTPAMRTGNEVTSDEGINQFAKIEKSNTTATIQFEPNLENQREISRMLGAYEEKGVLGQFIVQYDVELDPSNGEVLVSDGYFVHFYAPDDLPPLDKHVVFALDTSGSMGGRKIEQLKDAMKCILDQIKINDLVDILDFTTHVTFHDIETGLQIPINYEREENYQEPFYKYQRFNFPQAKPANQDLITKAKAAVDSMRATSSTNIIGALETGLYLVKLRKEKHLNYQPMVIFLTDGQPNVGISNPDEITNVVTQLNYKNQKTPIFALSFGEDADKKFLRKLSLDNYGFSRHIYEAADASLQLQQFYKQISSPLLSEVNFKYNPDVTQVTRTQFPIYFRGGHIVICGRHVDPQVLSVVNLYRRDGCKELKVNVEKSTSQIERLWAYLTIKQLLEQRERVEDKTDLTKKALDLALKYSFVTEVTSLVVVKPEESSIVDTENISIAPSQMGIPQSAGFGGPIFVPQALASGSPGFHMRASCLKKSNSQSVQAFSAPCSNSMSRGFMPPSSSPAAFGSTTGALFACRDSAPMSPSPVFAAAPPPPPTSSNLFGSTATSKIFGFAPNKLPVTTGFGINPFSSFKNNGGNQENAQISFGTGSFKVIIEDPKQMNEGNNSAENQDQVDKGNENSGPTDFVIDRPFLIMVKLKLDNKYIVSFMGNVAKPVFNN